MVYQYVCYVSQVEMMLEIPIVDDMDAEKDECFEVELYDPTGGAKIGSVSRIAVTITNDDGNYTICMIEFLAQRSLSH